MKKNHVIVNKTLPCLIFVPFDVEIIFWKCLWLITSISDTIELSIWQIGAFDGKKIRNDDDMVCFLYVN